MRPHSTQKGNINAATFYPHFLHRRPDDGQAKADNANQLQGLNKADTALDTKPEGLAAGAFPAGRGRRCTLECWPAVDLGVRRVTKESEAGQLTGGAADDVDSPVCKAVEPHSGDVE